jgi:ribose transport system ATP-binding protein
MLMTARENLTLLNLKPFWSTWRLRRQPEVAEVRRWFSRVDVRPADAVASPLASFSGGNQQKILFAKWLRQKPRVLLLDEPTQGVDVGAKAELHRQILEAAEARAAVVVNSTDVEELAAICTRVLIIRDGRIGDELVGDRVNESEIDSSLHAETAAA